MNELPRRILLATDFSPVSNRAARLAKSLARRFDAELHALHVRQGIDDPCLDSELLDEVKELLKTGDSKAVELLDQVSQDTRGLPYEGHIERRRSVSLAITDMASTLRCDLVVMGTHGRHGFKHFLMGSVAERVVRLCQVPVLTTGENPGFSDQGPQSILLAHDFSDHSLRAVRYAAAWARSHNGDVTLLHVIHPLVYHDVYALDDYHAPVWDRIIGRCHESLEEVAAEHLSGLRHSTAVVQTHAEQGITRYVSDHGCDMVVLGTRGLSGVEHLVMGSVAERVVRFSPVPVLTVP